MEIHILYRCENCASEMVAGVIGHSIDPTNAPSAIQCLLCSGTMTPNGSLTPEQVATWQRQDDDP